MVPPAPAMLLVHTTLGPSPIHGIGLFAAEPIPRGTTTWKYVDGFDLRLTAATVGILSAPAREQVLKYAYFDTALGLYELCSDDARFFNHADAPNTASIHSPDGGHIDIAVKDIARGEELTCDYRTFDRDWRSKLGR
jgi:uncharacterized protein